ncbi:hypothetical protein PIB30_084351 [Stylosanthes scabra]|uniref:Uncharacterized protein n=1 Tax=Stylosanthes scabra TaxID=79078 RepID=A0ABU6VUK0_9FABA|nr:hypothetical protein [Stylosanthes scabra]
MEFIIIYLGAPLSLHTKECPETHVGTLHIRSSRLFFLCGDSRRAKTKAQHGRMEGVKEANTEASSGINSEERRGTSCVRSVDTNTGGKVEAEQYNMMQVWQDMRKNEEMTRVHLENQALENNTMKGGVSRRGENGSLPPSWNPGTWTPCFIRRSRQIGLVALARTRRSEEEIRRKKSSPKGKRRWRLEFGKGEAEYDDYVLMPPIERSQFYMRLEKSTSTYGTVDDLSEATSEDAAYYGGNGGGGLHMDGGRALPLSPPPTTVTQTLSLHASSQAATCHDLIPCRRHLFSHEIAERSSRVVVFLCRCSSFSAVRRRSYVASRLSPPSVPALPLPPSVPTLPSLPWILKHRYCHWGFGSKKKLPGIAKLAIWLFFLWISSFRSHSWYNGYYLRLWQLWQDAKSRAYLLEQLEKRTTETAENSQVATARFQVAAVIREAAIREWGFLSVDDKRSLIREVLYPEERVQRDRDASWSLRPGKDVYDDEMALNPLNHCNETLRFIINRFMGYANEIKKQHDELTYLDSCKCMKERAGRIEAMTFVANKLEFILKDPDFYHNSETLQKAVGDYHLREPLNIDEHTRMRIAIDLMLSKANPIREEVLERATAHWDKCERAASKHPVKMPANAKNKHAVTKSAVKGTSSKGVIASEAISVESSGSQSLTIYQEYRPSGYFLNYFDMNHKTGSL